MTLHLEQLLAGSFDELAKQEIESIAFAATEGVKYATEGLKYDWRGQIRGPLGQKLANTVRSAIYPEKGTSINAAGRVYSKASYMHAFEDGATIKSKDGFYLAVPTEAAGTGLKGKSITPGEWERRTGIRLKFVYRQGGPSLLVADMRARGGKRGGFGKVSARSKTGLSTVVIFMLVPQVRIRKVVDLKSAGIRWGNRLGPAVVSIANSARRNF